MLLPLLAEKNVPLLLGPVISTRTKPELKNKSLGIFEAFSKQGLPFAIITDHPEQPIDTLYLSAALAHRAGLDKKQALAAITISAAKCVDLDKRIGSLTVGKDADIVIQSGELFTLDAKTEAVFVNGTLAFSAKK